MGFPRKQAPATQPAGIYIYIYIYISLSLSLSQISLSLSQISFSLSLSLSLYQISLSLSLSDLSLSLSLSDLSLSQISLSLRSLSLSLSELFLLTSSSIVSPPRTQPHKPGWLWGSLPTIGDLCACIDRAHGIHSSLNDGPSKKQSMLEWCRSGKWVTPFLFLVVGQLVWLLHGQSRQTCCLLPDGNSKATAEGHPTWRQAVQPSPDRSYGPGDRAGVEHPLLHPNTKYLYLSQAPRNPVIRKHHLGLSLPSEGLRSFTQQFLTRRLVFNCRVGIRRKIMAKEDHRTTSEDFGPSG